MKKIVRVRKAMQGLAMALALATTVSGCSIDNANELTKENSIAYESIEETEVKDSVEEKENSSKELEDSNKETENSLDKNEIEEEANRKRIPENGLKEDTSAEVINVDNHNYKEDYFVVMFEGQELVIPNLSRQFISQDYVKNSIIKALVLGGFGSEYSYRKTLARFYEIENYRGTAEQNVTLLNYLRHPELYLNMDLVLSLDIEEKANTEVSQNNGIQNTNGENGSNLGNEDHDDNGKDNGDHDKDKGNEKHKHSLKTEVTYEQLPDNQHRKVTTVTCKGKKNGKPCTYKKVTYGEPENCKFDKDTLECICGRKHTHEYGDEIITYVDAEGTTHTKIVSKECIYGDDTIEVSRTKSEHNFINYVVNDGTNTETGTCECGKTDTRTITIAHEHVIKTEVTYEQLDNNQHRKVTTSICTGKIDGKPCTYKKVKYGEPENCKFDKDSLECVCGRVHNHTYGPTVTTYIDKEGKTHTKVVTKDCTYGDDHVEVSRTTSDHVFENYIQIPGTNTEKGTCECGKADIRDIKVEHEHIEKVETTYEQLPNNQHRKVTTTTCTGYIDGEPCTYKKVEYGEPENCKFDKDTLECICGRVHVHDWKWVKVDDENCEQVCTYDETHRGIKSPHISDGTGTVTVVPGSGTASGHDTHNDTHCTKCDEDYTITNNNVAHGSETQTEVGTPTYTQTTQDGQDGHIKTTTYKYSSCGYEYTVNGEFTVCIDNGTGSCDCGRVMTHTCNFEEIPQTLTSEEAMTYCRISKFVCSECGKEDESRTIKIPHDPYREAIPDDIFDKIGCNKCSHVLVPSIGFESDWSWEYDGVSFSLGVLSEDTYSLSSEETSSAADEVTEENVPEDTEDRQEENETQEGVSQEETTDDQTQETTDDQTQETTDDQTQEESGEESQEDEENLGQDQGEQEQTEESQDAQESEEEENSQGKVEEATQEELKHEEEYIEKDETDLYVAYNEAVSEYLKQYSLPQNKPKALYRSERC